MAKRRVLKPQPQTKSKTFRDVPSEILDLFNSMSDDDEYYFGKSKTQFFIELIKSESIKRIGEELTNNELDRYCRKRERWNKLVISRNKSKAIAP